MWSEFLLYSPSLSTFFTILHLIFEYNVTIDFEQDPSRSINAELEALEQTQKEVADIMGISQSYISRIEKKILGKMKKDLEKVI